jgi:hypothetical protein
MYINSIWSLISPLTGLAAKRVVAYLQLEPYLFFVDSVFTLRFSFFHASSPLLTCCRPSSSHDVTLVSRLCSDRRPLGALGRRAVAREMRRHVQTRDTRGLGRPRPRNYDTMREKDEKSIKKYRFRLQIYNSHLVQWIC